SAYQTIVARDGNFQEVPYGATTPPLPYLPDPVAGGASVRKIVPNGISTADPTKIPFNGTWPASHPVHLRLREAAPPPTWDHTARLFVVSLPKGRTATYELGCYMDTGTLGNDPESDNVKDLALFNYWNAVVTPRKGLHRDRKVFWADATAGRNEQLT